MTWCGRRPWTALGLTWLPAYDVALVPNTQLLEIRVIDTDPLRAQAVATELVRQLVERSPSATDRDRQDRRLFVTRQLQELETNIDNTTTRIDDLQLQLAGMFSARQIADTQTQISALEQKLNSYQANYAQLLTFLQGGVNTINVVEPASLPTVPIGPNKTMTILLAAVIGLLLALGAAFLLDYLDDTLKTADDVRAATDLPTLGAITRIDAEQAGRHSGGGSAAQVAHGRGLPHPAHQHPVLLAGQPAAHAAGHQLQSRRRARAPPWPTWPW